MVRLLPFILIPILIVGGLGYWRFVASKPSLNTTQTEVSGGPVEVPKTLPAASLEDRVEELEKVVIKLVTEVNALKSPTSSNSSGTKVSELDSSVVDLKARITALEKATPAPVASSSKSTVFIPLGSGGGPWGNNGWFSLDEYQVVLDPANYPGYSGMKLEVIFRLTEAIGTASVRLYNVTDSAAISSQVDSTSTSFNLLTSSSFTLPSGSKTYKLQLQSSQSVNMQIQSARIRVSF